MRFRLAILPLLLAAALAGCKTGPHMASFIENRNAEARQLEDEYWYQVQENERLAYELAKARGQAGGRAAGPATPGRSDGGDRPDLQPPVIEEGTMPPEIEIPDAPPPSEPSRRENRFPENPPIEVESLPSPEIDAEPAPQMPGVLPPTKKITPAKNAALSKSVESEVTDHQATHLFVNPLHTGGIDLDRQPGDDGLSVVIEPRNAADQFVPLAGGVSLVLLDPSKSGEAARLARWNFSAAEIEPLIVTEGDARGIHLELPWPSRRPERDQLQLFIRYVTPDGRKLEIDREVFIALPGQVSQRWTPRPAERQRRNDPLAGSQGSGGRESGDRGQESGTRSREGVGSPVASATSVPPTSAPPLLEPPPSLSDAPAAPARPTWKPYR